MTNFERWQNYMSGFRSPQIYVDFGFYYIIAAALERRVWYGPDHSPLFPNMYVTFVGPPGVGKGLVLKQCAVFLRHHKWGDKVNKDHKPVVPKADEQDATAKALETEKELSEAASSINANAAQKEDDKAKKKKGFTYEKPSVIHVAADATTYEALVSNMAESLRMKPFIYKDDKGVLKNGIYTYSCTCFCLEELSSLMRKHADDVVQFLMVGYDCGDYKKDTKGCGTDKIQRVCVNFLAGTTPSFMQRTFSDGLLNEGYSSRSLFLFAPNNRHNNLIIPDLTPEQIQCRSEILDHILKLTQVYGRVTTSPETEEFLQAWWTKQQEHKKNVNEKLIHYYARKDIHMRKLAMAIHFAESTDMQMGIEPHVKAIKMLEHAEAVMHHALVHGSDNKLYKPGEKIMTFLDEEMPQGATEKELLTKFWGEILIHQLREILTHFIIMGKIVTGKKAMGQREVECYKRVQEC